MRIFYASDTTPNATLESNIWRNNLYRPLVDLGHDVVEFRYDLRETFQKLDPVECRAFIRKNRPKVSSELLAQIREAHSRKQINLFFSYFYDACVLPEAIDEIRAMGIRTVNWYCNGSYQLELVSEISPHYDWCLVPEKFRLADYVAMGARPIYCQEAANPETYRPYALPKEFDVTFVGQAYGERPQYIRLLLDNGIDVRVWGPGWNNYGEVAQQSMLIKARLLLGRGKRVFAPGGLSVLHRRLHRVLSVGFAHQATLPAEILGDSLSDSEMTEMYSRSKINLGFSSCGNTHLSGERILQVRLRDFEVPMSGGFYMTEYMEELEEFFNIGQEIVCYKNPDDLVDKIKYYLANESMREAIRLAGYERCLHDHTWHKRFEAAFKEMGLKT